MVESRIDQHPVLPIPERERIGFYWGDTYLQARRGEVITTALIANGINIFGIHAHDNSAQGIFCANGQCSRCMVIADGVPVKGCMTPVRPDMKVEKLSGLPTLPDRSGAPLFQPVTEKHIDVLIIGAGPAGLSAALELGKLNIPTLVIDDKDEAGGKLVLQTHKFFGSVEDSRAGTRGNHIGKILADELKKMPTVDLWLSSTAIYVYKDKKVGILKGKEYQLITPKVLINAAGAREKFIRFPGNQLVGIYGAGAFQTLVNRDLVRPAKDPHPDLLDPGQFGQRPGDIPGRPAVEEEVVVHVAVEFELEVLDVPGHGEVDTVVGAVEDAALAVADIAVDARRQPGVIPGYVEPIFLDVDEADHPAVVIVGAAARPG